MVIEGITMHVKGIIKGKHITLTHETGLPDGVFVMIDIRYNPLSLEQKHKIVDRLCGSWASDPSIHQTQLPMMPFL